MSIGLTIIVCILIGYALGNLNPAYVVGLLKGYDVRKTGSGNAGASNALLIAGKLAFFVVALFDIFKTVAAWKICESLFPELPVAGIVGGVSCLVGHIFPVLLKFKGGKGFACLGGIILAFDVRAFLLLLLLALILAYITKYVAITACGISMVWPGYYYAVTRYALGSAILCLPIAIMFYKHIENFKRIREGKELRLSYLFNKQKELERTGYK